MDISIRTNSHEPVYEQIVRQIHDGVRSGELAAGAQLPPVRQLAGDLHLNRNTVARAYKTLEQQGVIRTGSKGAFVHLDASTAVTQTKHRRAHRVARTMIQALLADGLSIDEIFGVFNEAVRLQRRGA